MIRPRALHAHNVGQQFNQLEGITSYIILKRHDPSEFVPYDVPKPTMYLQLLDLSVSIFFLVGYIASFFIASAV